MRTPTFTLALAAMFLSAGAVLAQEESLSVDPEREVIVQFKPNVLQPPASRLAGPLTDFQIASPTLRQVLAGARVEHIARIARDVQPEDRTFIRPDGQEVTLADWTDTYVLRLPAAAARDAFITALEALPDVVYAEPNGRGTPDVVPAPLVAPLIPNDTNFGRQWAFKNDGTSLQGSGTSDADVDGPEAWDITAGSSTIRVGIVDAGMQTNHPDFTGRVTGDAGDNNAHGTAVAGVVAAKGNNNAGVAGMAWNVGIINEDYGGATDLDFFNAVRSASTRGANVINNSWKLTYIGVTQLNQPTD